MPLLQLLRFETVSRKRFLIGMILWSMKIVLDTTEAFGWIKINLLSDQSYLISLIQVTFKNLCCTWCFFWNQAIKTCWNQIWYYLCNVWICNLKEQSIGLFDHILHYKKDISIVQPSHVNTAILSPGLKWNFLCNTNSVPNISAWPFSN